MMLGDMYVMLFVVVLLYDDVLICFGMLFVFDGMFVVLYDFEQGDVCVEGYVVVVFVFGLWYVVF